MDKKIIKLKKKMYDVVSPEEYIQNSHIYDHPYTALEFKELDLVLPLKSKLDIINETGVYHTNVVNVLNTQTISDEYNSSNIVDLNSRNMKEVIEKSEAIKSLETEILTNSENIYEAKIKDTDSSALKLIKSAASMKHCDLDSYQQRFGANYNNDIRHLKNQGTGSKKKISLDKLVSIADKLDMKVELSLEDKSPDVPNPMGEKISVILNSVVEDEKE